MMYRVECDGTTIYQPGEEEYTLIGPKLNIEVNKSGSLDFIIPPSHPSYDTIEKMKSSLVVFQGELEIFEGRATEVFVDYWNRKKVHCEGQLSYLNDSIQRPMEYKGSVRGYLEKLISRHNSQVEANKHFVVGAVTTTDKNDYILRYTNWETTLKAISEDLIDSLGGYIFIRKENGKRYIDYLADFNNTNTQAIEFGENLLDFSKNFDCTDIATVVVPLGARKEEAEIEALGERVTIESVNNGSDAVKSEEAIKIYGKIERTVTFDNVSLPANLKRKGEEYLTRSQWEKLTLEVKAIDLHFIKGNFEQFKLGDTIRVVSKPHGMDANFPLSKMSLKLDSLSENTVTLGTEKRLSLSASTVQSSAEILQQISRLPGKNEILEQARANATALINQANNGFVVKRENELLIMDTNDIKTAKNVWRWNVNGLGYSSNGYNGPFETAITMDGHIVADMITGKLGEFVKLNANAIEVDSSFFNSSDVGKKIITEIDGQVESVSKNFVKQDFLYNNVKITPQRGLEVLDANNRQRVQLGNISPGNYGLKLVDSTGSRTVLDDKGILQMWQVNYSGNCNVDNPLTFKVPIPARVKKIEKAEITSQVRKGWTLERDKEKEDRYMSKFHPIFKIVREGDLVYNDGVRIFINGETLYKHNGGPAYVVTLDGDNIASFLRTGYKNEIKINSYGMRWIDVSIFIEAYVAY